MRRSRRQAALRFWDSHLWWQDCGCPLDLIFEQVSCCCTASVELGRWLQPTCDCDPTILPFILSNHCNHHAQLIALYVAGPCRCVLQVLWSRAALVDSWSDALPGTTSCWDHLCCAAVGCIPREQLEAIKQQPSAQHWKAVQCFAHSCNSITPLSNRMCMYCFCVLPDAQVNPQGSPQCTIL
jgi:hypothetical protein